MVNYYFVRHSLTCIAIALLAVTVGCRPTVEPAKTSEKHASGEERQAASSASRKKPSVATVPRPTAKDKDAASDDEKKQPAQNAEPSRPVKRPPRRTLGDLLEMPTDATDRWMHDAIKVKVDEKKVAAAGIRKLEGRHLVLYTDFPPGGPADRLTEIFDQAVPQWRDYFQVDQAKVDKWRLTGFLIHDRKLFRKLGLLPAYLPPFAHGFCLNTDFWVYDKPGDYVDRHLVLHEGTHCFMNAMFGACGPPWYMEGMAELLSTHRLVNDENILLLNQMPLDRDEVPWLGRIKLVRDDVAAGKARSLKRVLGYRYDAFLENGPYAWSWATAMFLDRHPKYGDAFRKLRMYTRRPDLTRRFVKTVGGDWPALERQWRVFLDELDYGCNVSQMLIDPTPGGPLAPAGARVEVSAERGWQNSGLRLEKGKTYRLRAEGRYQVADRPRIWWCEPGGVTIRYYRGRPLGELLATILPDEGKEGKDADSPAPLKTIAIGLGATLTPDESGTLYFKINEATGEFADNAGRLSVEVRAE